jgi:hypothetical protein
MLTAATKDREFEQEGDTRGSEDEQGDRMTKRKEGRVERKGLVMATDTYRRVVSFRTYTCQKKSYPSDYPYKVMSI